MSDPVLTADPIKQRLTFAGPEPASEHLPVIGEDLIRDPMTGHRLR
jgi:hypothetical protein